MARGIAEEAETLRPGDFYIVPSNTLHRVERTAGPVVALDILSLVREDYKY